MRGTGAGLDRLDEVTEMFTGMAEARRGVVVVGAMVVVVDDTRDEVVFGDAFDVDANGAERGLGVGLICPGCNPVGPLVEDLLRSVALSPLVALLASMERSSP